MNPYFTERFSLLFKNNLKSENIFLVNNLKITAIPFMSINCFSSIGSQILSWYDVNIALLLLIYSIQNGLQWVSGI